MTDYLLFRLYGAMAAWGDIAVGEQRPSTPHPSKSALLGLLAAALGIRRHEDERHQALADGYGFAVRMAAAYWFKKSPPTASCSVSWVNATKSLRLR